ncbi:NADH:ubiquinone oxidoreductase subunit J [Embleya scabrispora]|uniref:NADH-quinone oxidoreductase subunit J n=2 Tax=Embleya scabrispora TaxID=159449 RepID=A0A1T3NXM3_9ACTN|nr:NADH-quinone oxidoreductase subunit J [Embleya scabrispora]OPC81524.1 NADH:ubiquinone oxidoreductase subunit J [Embleya scabrispora]
MSPGMDFAAEVTKTSTGEALQFWVLAAVALIGALATVFMKKAVHSALALVTTMMCLAIFYLAQGAVFLGIVQIVVYTGAIMMLFLFVLMLVGVSSVDSLKETLKGQRIAAAGLGLGFGILLTSAIANASITHFTALATKSAGSRPVYPAETDEEALRAVSQGNVQGLAHQIFTKYIWAFEMTSALLITAAVGAMVLAHRERLVPRKTQRELSEERVRDNKQVAPLPTPGVYARHNAVDVPALLPDGSISELSVNGTLRARGQIRDVSAEAVHSVAALESAGADDDDEAWPDESDAPASAPVPTARHEHEDPDPGSGDEVGAGAGSKEGRS